MQPPNRRQSCSHGREPEQNLWPAVEAGRIHRRPIEGLRHETRKDWLDTRRMFYKTDFTRYTKQLRAAISEVPRNVIYWSF